jgi:hypothetical protein
VEKRGRERRSRAPTSAPPGGDLGQRWSYSEREAAGSVPQRFRELGQGSVEVWRGVVEGGALGQLL